MLLNPNTISKAYGELEREGTVTRRPGAGVYVAPGAQERCRRVIGEELAAELARAVRAALDGGVSEEELRLRFDMPERGEHVVVGAVRSDSWTPADSLVPTTNGRLAVLRVDGAVYLVDRDGVRVRRLLPPDGER